MSAPVDRIKNAESLVSVFGYWPSFHDAEVVELALRRSGGGLGGPSAVATIHVFEMTNQVEPDGYFLCHKHSIVTLEFTDLVELSLDGLNHQNALSELVVEEAEPGGSLRVSLESAYGLDCSLVCNAMAVLSVVPGIPPGSVYSRGKA